ncbi:MAG: hypothetical protein OK455_05435 [Thaumarchaeota archaeon]|nr:hypothetical protein [Nitrososphaerota archaeon]
MPSAFALSSSPSDLPGLEARTMEEVRTSTRFLLNSFKEKIAELKRSGGADIQQLLRFGVDQASASSTGREFFGGDEVEYIAVDGTCSVDQQLDLLVFYVGAFGYSGSLRFLGDRIDVGDPSPMSRSSAAVCASIPLSEEDAATVFGQKTESGTEVEAERLPNALMRLAEYYIAIKATESDGRLKVVLLDRPLAGDVAHLVWSVHDLVKDHLSVLEGIGTPYGKVANFDLELARMLVTNPELKIPAPRSQLLKFAAISCLFGGEEMSVRQIVTRLGADQRHVSRLLQDFWELDSEYRIFEGGGRSDGQAKLDDDDLKFRLKVEVKDYRERVFSAALEVADHIFNPKSDHPLRIKSNDEEKWVTADDLDYLVLIFVLELTRRAWSKNLLPIGFIKDSGAAEFVKTVVPVLRNAGMAKLADNLPNFNSDKMLLQTNSVVNAASVPTPWHTADIDAAFRTMVPVHDAKLPPGEARVRGAYRNVVYPERMFVKNYIQLWSSKNDPSVRSHVFTFDRPAYPRYDHWDDLLLHNKDNEVDEKISPVLNFRNESEMTNLAMSILFQMASEVIPEALGHNYPLFLADKKAKFVLQQNKEAYVGAVRFELAKSELDQQVLFSQRFRDYRSQVEARRRGSGGG